MTAGYIFDYGATLDTGGQHWGRALWHAYERHHVPVSEAHFREAYVYAERTLGSQRIIMPTDTFRTTLETKLRLQLDYLGGLSHRSPLTAYLSPLLEDLYASTREQTARSRDVLLQLKAQVPLALVSNFYGNLHVVLREFGLDQLFCAVIESAVVGVRKPDPRIFTLAVEAMHLTPAEVTVVGDSLEKDIMPAHEAGCHTVWLRGEGWTSDSQNRECPFCETIDSLDELLEMIKTR